MNPLQILPMDEQSIPQVHELEEICFASPWSKRSLRQMLNDPLAVCYTAQSGGEVVGYIGMHCIFGEGHILNLAVAPTHRRRGIANILLETLLTYARKHDFTLLTLEVRASNMAAIALYWGLGFISVGLRRGYYDTPREDALIMTLEIGETQ